ncbi:MAG: beta-ketoacyl-ACP synthase II [Actinomycetota bacterium]|nr:beta-ketoacyl-ACP synthase II [Actinomycetota bacterium]
MRRVAVTGIGAVTPLGNDARTTWRALLAGRSGIGRIGAFDPTPFPVRIAGEVKDFDAACVVAPKKARNLDRAVLFALAATKEALADAGMPGSSPGSDGPASRNGYRPERVGVALGSCVGGVNQLMHQYDVLRDRGPDRVSPFFLANILVDSPSGHVALEFGLRGPNYAPVSACATGSHSVGEGAELIRRGDADAVVAGGTEGSINPLILAGFCSMRGLAAENGDPARASRPFDATRSGFVMAEGAGVLVLEELESARARGARIYAEVLGHASSNDAYHMTAPEPAAVGVAAMMRQALERASVAREAVGYVNAHGTGTPLGDAAETKAIKEVFGARAYELPVSSTKSMLGHMFAASGAVEAMVCALVIHEGTIPPTINYEHPDPDCDLDYVPNEARAAKVDVALSNAMGLGGHNACVVLGRVD